MYVFLFLVKALELKRLLIVTDSCQETPKKEATVNHEINHKKNTKEALLNFSKNIFLKSKNNVLYLTYY